MAAHPTSAILRALARFPGAAEAALRPPRSRLERAGVKRTIHWSFAAFNRRDLIAAFALLPTKVEWRILIHIHAFNPAPHTGLELNIGFVQTWEYENGVHRIRERLTEAASGITGFSPGIRDA